MILTITFISLFYIFITLLCKMYYGEYFHYKFIHSYQTHLEGNTMSIHILSSLIMFTIILIQMLRKVKDKIHVFLGRIFMINIFFILFPTSTLLSLGVYSKTGTGLDTVVIRTMFLESATGVFFSSLMSWYSIAYCNNVRNHLKFNKICVSYSLTPMLDRFLIYLFQFYFDYDTSHRIAIIILFVNMVYFGFLNDFIFVSTKKDFKLATIITPFRWLVYLFIIHIWKPFNT